MLAELASFLGPGAIHQHVLRSSGALTARRDSSASIWSESNRQVTRARLPGLPLQFPSLCREEITELRTGIMAMISKVRTAKGSKELLVMQREVDAIIRDTLDCHDDGAIDEEDLAAFGLVFGMFMHSRPNCPGT